MNKINKQTLIFIDKSVQTSFDIACRGILLKNVDDISPLLL